MTGWQEYVLEDVCEIVDCLNRTAPSTEEKTPYKMLRTSNIKNGVINTEDVRYVSKETYSKWTRRSVPQKYDVIFTREAPMGEVGIIRDSGSYILGQRTMQFRANNNVITPLFLFYSLQAPFIQKQVEAYEGTGSVVSHLRVADVKNFKIKVPPLEIQYSIETILNSIDEKIQTNKKIINTLEQISKTLYKYWFVDFGPFKDKGFVESKLGLIPKGWGIATNKDMFELAYGKALRQKDRIPGNIPVIGSGGQVDWHNKEIVAGPSIVIGRKGNAGHITWVNQNFYPIDTTFYIHKNCISKYYLYFSLHRQRLEDKRTDSAVPGLNRDVAYSLSLVVPPNDVIKDFEDKIKNYFDLIHQNKTENSTLLKTRNYILPRLLSGEIGIKDTVKMMKEVLTNG